MLGIEIFLVISKVKGRESGASKMRFDSSYHAIIHPRDIPPGDIGATLMTRSSWIAHFLKLQSSWI